MRSIVSSQRSGFNYWTASNRIESHRIESHWMVFINMHLFLYRIVPMYRDTNRIVFFMRFTPLIHTMFYINKCNIQMPKQHSVKTGIVLKYVQETVGKSMGLQNLSFFSWTRLWLYFRQTLTLKMNQKTFFLLVRDLWRSITHTTLPVSVNVTYIYLSLSQVKQSNFINWIITLSTHNEHPGESL